MSELFQHPTSPQFGQSPSEGNGQPTDGDESVDRQREVYQVACERFQQNPDWATFFREFLGVEGVVRKTFEHPQDLNAFEQGDAYSEIQHMVAKLRERSKTQTESSEPTRVITVRLPKSLHESLKEESHQRRTSMNQLCISKLLQVIDNDLVPSD